MTFYGISIQAQEGIKYPSNENLPEIKIYNSNKIEKLYIKAHELEKSGEQPHSTFEVNYSGFSDEARIAFARAVELWSYLIYSTVPIKIDASWEVLEPGILGSCGPKSYYRDFRNAPVSLTWFPVAMANKIAGYDLDPTSSDIRARFSSVFNWYLGTDGLCPTNKHDFVSTVMHEIGHGLGFIGSADVSGTTGNWGNGTNIPMIFDRFVYSGSNNLVIDTFLYTNPSTLLKTIYTSNDLYFHSPLSDAANGNLYTKIYAPSTWNAGSSYSHLDEIFNDTPHAMMTYSAGYGEVTHHPGTITLAMFAEMGWIGVLFNHASQKDIESMPNPIDITTEIYSDSALIDGSVKLHYSNDNFVTDNAVTLTTANDTLFEGSIPALTGTVKYYFEAKNSLNRTYYYPVGSDTSVDKALSFIIGTDETSPEITHQPEDYILANIDTYEISFLAFDNLGIDSIYIEYKINNSDVKTVSCDILEANNFSDQILYSGTISFENETLNDGDILYYQIIAVDKAQVSNSIIMPSSTEWYQTNIYSFGTATQDLTINFNNTGDENLFILNGLSITQPAGFTSKGLHSPHPYEQGQNFQDNEISYSAILKTPIILRSTNALIKFDEIVLVEPGEEGSSYGDSDFWDYVIIEGSKDLGNTWKDLVDGWDCTTNSSFVSAYNSNLNGTESMYKSHIIDLTQKSDFNANDTVLIRFRLWSDPLTVSWGWAIDNIEIQGLLSPTEDYPVNNSIFDIFPNPSKGEFTIALKTTSIVGHGSVNIINTSGSVVYEKTINESDLNQDIQVNLKGISSGIYFVRLVTEKEIYSKKIVIQ